ncbi:MAG: flagellar assembly protein FliH [Spirochaetales bacterium]|nr:flagellar assembly protein FliH [Spirochaetales bacterium]
MAKNVFRPAEVIQGTEKVFIEAPDNPAFKGQAGGADLEVLDDVEEYKGPTADDLRKEAELFRHEFEHDKEKMITGARLEAEKIIKAAETSAFDQIRLKTEEAADLRRQAEEESEKIRSEAARISEQTIRESQDKADQIREEAKKAGYTEGREAGWAEGRAEAQRVIERLHIILSKAIEKRFDILKDSEAQVIHLILQIARKVVKVISENQKNIVINNTVQALQKLKNKSDVVIRVNLADLNLVTEHTKDIINMVENVKTITVMEDSTVDRGGCVIETDFGEIDARIAAQLREIEERILELSPIQTAEKYREPV